PETASPPKSDGSPEEMQFAETDERNDALAVPQMETDQAERGGDAAPPEQIASAPPVATLREAHPLYLKNPAPDYPRAARRRGYEGTVIFEVLVDTRGRVGALRVLESSGHNILDRAASMSVKDWVFEPGRSGEEKVEMWVKIPVRFEIK
ncbi:MAG: energy transducer TonB, partial [Desulfatiglandaceae bacterium]